MVAACNTQPKYDQLNAYLRIPIKVHWGISFPFGLYIQMTSNFSSVTQGTSLRVCLAHYKYTTGLLCSEKPVKFEAYSDQLLCTKGVELFYPY